MKNELVAILLGGGGGGWRGRPNILRCISCCKAGLSGIVRLPH